MEAKSWKQSRGSEGGQGDIGNLAIHNHASTCSAVLVGSVAAGGFSGRITSASLSRDDRIEAEQRQQVSGDLIPDNVPLQELAEQVVRGKVKLTPPQLRMLIELLPFHLPKLSAVGVGYMTNNTFAERLDRAIDRSERAKLIEGRAIEVTTNRKSRPHHC
jgi:hypothetical protein